MNYQIASALSQIQKLEQEKADQTDTIAQLQQLQQTTSIELDAVKRQLARRRFVRLQRTRTLL